MYQAMQKERDVNEKLKVSRFPIYSETALLQPSGRTWWEGNTLSEGPDQAERKKKERNYHSGLEHVPYLDAQLQTEVASQEVPAPYILFNLWHHLQLRFNLQDLAEGKQSKLHQSEACEVLWHEEEGCLYQLSVRFLRAAHLTRDQQQAKESAHQFSKLASKLRSELEAVRDGQEATPDEQR